MLVLGVAGALVATGLLLGLVRGFTGGLVFALGTGAGLAAWWLAAGPVDAAAASTGLPSGALAAAIAVAALLVLLAGRGLLAWIGLKRQRASLGSRLIGVFTGGVAGAGLAMLVLMTAATDGDAQTLRRTAVYPAVHAAGTKLLASPAVRTRLGTVTMPAPIAPPSEAQEGPPPRPIAWARVAAAGGTVERAFTGTVAAGESVDLSFEIGGDVAQIAVRVGERVAAGQILARLDPTAVRLELNEREAALADVTAQLVEAEAVLRRKTYLTERGVESKAALDNAEAAAGSARAQVTLAQASVDRARDRLADTALTAPYAGRIAAQLAEPSAVVRAGEPVLRIEDETSAYEIVIDVPEAVIDDVEKGQTHVVHGPTGETRNAVVTEIGTRRAGTATFPVTLTIADGAGLRVGMTRRVVLTLDTGQDEGLVVPAQSIVMDPDGAPQVFRYADGVVAAVPVTLATYRDADAIVSGPLNRGDIVASRGAAFLTTGQAVTLMGVGIARYED